MAAEEGVLVGYHPVREALRHRPHDVETLLVGRTRGGKRRREMIALAERHGVGVIEVDPAELGSLGVEVDNGFAVRLRPDGSRSGAGTTGDPDLVVLLEDVQDPRNLGALLRVCEGAGVGRVLIRDRGSAPLTPTAIRASAGAAEWVDVQRITNTARALEELKADGYWVYGAAAGGGEPWTIELTGKVVICLGGEEKGLRARTRDVCDGLLGLPMQGRIESLNVATAAAAVLFEAVRQRTGERVLHPPDVSD